MFGPSRQGLVKNEMLILTLSASPRTNVNDIFASRHFFIFDSLAVLDFFFFLEISPTPSPHPWPQKAQEPHSVY